MLNNFDLPEGLLMQDNFDVNLTDQHFALKDEVQLLGYGESDSYGAWIKLRLHDIKHLENFRNQPKGTKLGKRYAAVFVEIGDDELPVAAPSKKGPYGALVTKLRNTFFCYPAVWKHIGSDDEYQAWCRLQKCIICGERDYNIDKGDYRCEYAHVRRAGDSGIAYKPLYSGVPMCHKHHIEQHSQGEFNKEFFEKEKIQHLINWCHETFKNIFDVESLSTVDPSLIREWAKERNIYEFLPVEYKLE